MSLFTGIGGIDLAAEWAGFETVGQCEFAAYPARVLEKHWPDVPRWKDVRDVTAKSFLERTGLEALTLLSGGFPCQPHSLAGKRKASADDRDLWGEFARCIREIKPRWVLGENVYGLLSSENGRFFGRILRDLAEMGYTAGWCCYGAVDVGAPHKRDRVFLVANANRNDWDEWRPEPKGQQRQAGFTNGGDDVANANSGGRGPGGKRGGMEKIPKRQENKPLQVEESGSRMDNTDSSGRKRNEWREYEQQLTDGSWWAVEPDVGRVAHGVSARVDRLKCLGNAVVPQQVFPILSIIADIEQAAQST